MLKTAGRVDTIIISDVHLGAPTSRVGAFPLLLGAHFEMGRFGHPLFSRLIVNGDLWDQPLLATRSPSRLPQPHRDLLEILKYVSRRGVEIAITRGNHDPSLASLLDSYVWSDLAGLNIALHGDTFDDFLLDHPATTGVAGWLYRASQRLDSTQCIPRHLKCTSKSWIRAAGRVRDAAVSYARRAGFRTVFCGHTHRQEIFDSVRGVRYVNSGGFTESPSSYVTVTDGRPAIVEF